ncbi:MAG: hypothetical protein JW902_10210 [Syntrophaceae bacterium]|nr:hypothetical protein [Syntrophaceae bacterium]
MSEAIIEKAIEFLAANACPSIKLRLLREFYGLENEENEESLKTKIYNDKKVVNVISNQQKDGWIWKVFHGTHSHEAGIRTLCEKGFTSDDKEVRIALEAIDRYPERVNSGLGRPGWLLDDAKVGGKEIIKAAVFSYAGIENRNDVQEQIGIAIEAFSFVARMNNTSVISESFKGKVIFKEGIQWPSIYHLRLLAHTDTWRNQSNMKKVEMGVKKLIALSPMPIFKLRFKSQLVAPASFSMQDFRFIPGKMNGLQWMMWLHRSELLAKLGMFERISELKKQKQEFERILKGSNNLFTQPLSHGSFHNWGAYTGLSLEGDWKNTERRTCDLTFRALMILKKR